MNKLIVQVILAVSMISLTLSGCGGGSTSTISSGSSTSSSSGSSSTDSSDSNTDNGNGNGNSGSGSGPFQPTSATLKLSMAGSLPSGSTALAGVGLTVYLPKGVSVKTLPDGSVDPSVVTPSGGANNAAAVSVYTAPTETDNAKLAIVISAGDAVGFGTGEFATISCMIANGVFPTATDFFLSNLQPTALPLYVTVTGMTAPYIAEIK